MVEISSHVPQSVIQKELAFVPLGDPLSWAKQVPEPIQHLQTAREYCNSQAQTHCLLTGKQDHNTGRYNARVLRVFHNTDSLIVVYQKKVAKLRHNWKGLFKICGPGGVHGLTWTIYQLKSKGKYHDDHLRALYKRKRYFPTGEASHGSRTMRLLQKRKRRKKEN